MLAWLRTDDARRQVGRLARRYELSGLDASPDDVLADASVAVWKRLRRGPLEVANPAGYGTQVIRSVLRAVAGGRDGVPVDTFDDRAATGPALGPDLVGFVPAVEDRLRAVLVPLTEDRPWLTSATLGWLALVGVEGRPAGAPWPRAGSTPTQSRCWPALWYAGQRALFADPVDARDAARLRRTRARRIAEVLDRLEEAAARVGLAAGAGRG